MLKEEARARVGPLKHGGELAYAVLLMQQFKHGGDRLAADAAVPVLAAEHIGDRGAAVLAHGGLHIAGGLAARQADDPVQPLLATVGRAARFQALEALAQ